MLSYKNQKFPYAHAVFSHKNVCVFIFEKLGSKKRVVKRVGSVVMPILAFKSKNSSNQDRSKERDSCSLRSALYIAWRGVYGVAQRT